MTTLGKYEILEEIGRGGFGVVYKARDTTLDRLVALKVLHPQLTVDPKFVQRFHQEARTAASFQHPQIVTIHEVGEEAGQHYLAMALLPGRTLDRQLEIARSTLASYEKSRRLVMLRHQRGMVSGQDVAQVDALVHTAGAKIPDLERQIGQKENEICILLGINPQPIRRGKPLPELVVRAQVPAGLPSALLERRPDIRQTEEVLIAANYRIGAARANFFPRITLTGFAGTQSADLGRLFTGPSSIWNIGPTLTLPIFTAGFNYYTLQATKAQKEQALILYQFTVRQAFREVSDGLLAHYKFHQFRQQQEALVRSYQKYSNLANKRYKGGIASYLAVLDADRQLFTAELDLAVVEQNQLLTLVQLYKALGGGWETEGKSRQAGLPVIHPANTAKQ